MGINSLRVRKHILFIFNSLTAYLSLQYNYYLHSGTILNNSLERYAINDLKPVDDLIH